MVLSLYLPRPLLPKFGETGSVYPGLRLHIVATGLRKLYTKLESGKNLVMHDVYCLAMMMLFTGLKYSLSCGVPVKGELKLMKMMMMSENLSN